MEPEVKTNSTTSDFGVDEIKVDINTEESGRITAFSSASDDANEQWKDIADKASKILAELPDYLTGFFNEYRRPIITIGLVFGSIVVAKLTLAVLGSVNEIPLLAPTFELIGIGYSAWFIYRYLLRASNRKELGEDFNTLKEQVLGQRK